MCSVSSVALKQNEEKKMHTRFPDMFVIVLSILVHSKICTVHKPDADTHLFNGGTPADSYQTAWGSYMEEKSRLGNKKRRLCHWERELTKQQD